LDLKCSDGKCSFDIKNRADSAKVAGMHEARPARVGKMSDVIPEAKVLVKKLWTGEFRVNVCAK